MQHSTVAERLGLTHQIVALPDMFGERRVRRKSLLCAPPRPSQPQPRRQQLLAVPVRARGARSVFSAPSVRFGLLRSARRRMQGRELQNECGRLVRRVIIPCLVWKNL